MNPGSGQLNVGRAPKGESPSFNNASISEQVYDRNKKNVDSGGNQESLAIYEKPETLSAGPLERGPEYQTINSTSPLQGSKSTPAADSQVKSDDIASDDSSAHYSHPDLANDGDKIEQAWVDAAKKVVLATKGDPYSQASEVAALMRDYIRKRYRKDIGKTQEN